MAKTGIREVLKIASRHPAPPAFPARFFLNLRIVFRGWIQNPHIDQHDGGCGLWVLGGDRSRHDA